LDNHAGPRHGWFVDFFSGNGQTLSRRNDIATCGNCEGAFPIYGTADTILDEGLPLVRHLDRVLCPCNENRILSGHPEFLIREGGDSNRTHVIAERAVPASNQLDEQVHATGIAERYPYFIETADGRTFSGRIDTSGALPRVLTGESAGQFTVYWGDDALSRSN
jgi:hypothetical protein